MNQNSNRNMLLLASVVLLGFMAARFLVHPLHARADDVNRDYEELLARVDGWPGKDAVLAPLRSELSRRTSMMETEQRPVPARPDLAGLIRQLSLDIDGTRVIDQTFAAGRRGPAATAAPETWRSVPLTMELVSEYDALNELLLRIERSPDPIRITRLSVERIDGAVSGRAIARATLVLDAVYRIKEQSR